MIYLFIGIKNMLRLSQLMFNTAIKNKQHTHPRKFVEVETAFNDLRHGDTIILTKRPEAAHLDLIKNSPSYTATFKAMQDGMRKVTEEWGLEKFKGHPKIDGIIAGEDFWNQGFIIKRLQEVPTPKSTKTTAISRSLNAVKKLFTHFKL